MSEYGLKNKFIRGEDFEPGMYAKNRIKKQEYNGKTKEKNSKNG